ncbi:MAG TPA: hypothetical protein VIL72_03965 [Beijerinckiaceae bacterium]|jgi:hypothetical protein
MDLRPGLRFGLLVAGALVVSGLPALAGPTGGRAGGAVVSRPAAAPLRAAPPRMAAPAPRRPAFGHAPHPRGPHIRPPAHAQRPGVGPPHRHHAWSHGPRPPHGEWRGRHRRHGHGGHPAGFGYGYWGSGFVGTAAAPIYPAGAAEPPLTWTHAEPPLAPCSGPLVIQVGSPTRKLTPRVLYGSPTVCGPTQIVRYVVGAKVVHKDDEVVRARN